MTEREPGYIIKAFATERHAKSLTLGATQDRREKARAKFALNILARDLGRPSFDSSPRVIELPGPQNPN